MSDGHTTLDRISGLEGRLTAVETELAVLRAENDTLKTTIAELQGARTCSTASTLGSTAEQSQDLPLSPLRQIQSESEFNQLLRDAGSNRVVVLLLSLSSCRHCKTCRGYLDGLRVSPRFSELVLAAEIVVDTWPSAEAAPSALLLGESDFPVVKYYLAGEAKLATIGPASASEVEAGIQAVLKHAASAPLGGNITKLTSELAFSVQPSLAELKALSKSGIKSVINMRCEWEDGLVAEEEEILKSQSVEYVVCPLATAAGFSFDYMETLRRLLHETPKPVLVHCNVGLTAAVASLLYVATQVGAQPKDVFEWAGGLGYNLSSHAEVYNFVTSYLGQ